ncbi:MAG TPA: DegQ family serine endoprotease [Burkholderiales bacterium]|nr:DegQ family serine endoprotease [Burkholderiales bacterium]
MTGKVRFAVLAAAAVSLFAIYSRGDLRFDAHAASAPAAATAPANTVYAVPDFSALVEREGPAVVNITAHRAKLTGAERSGPGPQGPGPFFGPSPFGQPFPNFPQPTPQMAQGSGFIIKPDGYVLTNAHVVAGSEEVSVKLIDKREFNAKVIGTDPRTDVALLKIDAKELPTVRVGDPGKVKVGQWVAAIGSPFGFENSITAGIVSAKGRALPDETYVPFIQTDTAVNPGNSGGPLFDLNGEVIGINSQIYSRTGGYMGLAFAIPIDIAMDVANQLQANGKVTRGRIGVQIQELSADLAKSFGLGDPRGALVSTVEKDGPADKAGVKAGDVILEFDGGPVSDSRQLPLIVARVKPGHDAAMKVWREGKEQTLHVTVGELQPERVALAGGPRAERGKLGLAVQDLTPEQRKELDVRGGVLVGSVDGPAARAGLKQGDVVLAVNGEQIESAKHFKSLVDKAPDGKPVALLIQRGDVRLYVPVTSG